MSNESAPVAPPDMVGAGMMQQPPPPADLMGALSMGNMPAGALQQMMQPAQPVGGLGQAISAMGAGVYASRGQQDPVAQQQMEQQRLQMEQQRQMMQMQEHQQEREWRKNKAAMDLIGSAYANPNTSAETLKVLGPQYAKLAKQYLGVDLPPSMVTRALSADDIDKIRAKVLLGEDDSMLLTSFPKATPEDLQKIRALPKTDRVYKYLNIATDDDIKKNALDLKLKEAQVLKEYSPELNGDPKTSQAAAILHRKLYGTSLLDGTPDQRANAIRLAILQQRQTAIDDFTKMETIREQLKEKFARAKAGSTTLAESAAIYVDKAGNPAPSNLTTKDAAARGYFRITPHEFDIVNSSQQAFTILQNFKGTVEAMKKNDLFVKSEGLTGLYESGMLQYEKRLGDPKVGKMLLRNFDSQKAQLVILLRQLGDKGVRALGAFSPIMDAVSTSGGAPAIESIMAQIESEFVSLGQKSRTPDLYTEKPTIFTPPQAPGPLKSPASSAPPGFKKVSP